MIATPDTAREKYRRGVSLPAFYSIVHATVDPPRSGTKVSAP